MLTDVLHLVPQIRREPHLPLWTVCLIVIPEYAAIMLFGVESHVLSLILAGSYLRRNNGNRWVIPVELVLNLLCSFGIYLGRFQRLNSWDIATAPEKHAIEILEDLANQFAVAVTLVGFVGLTLIYYAFKFVNVAVIEYVRRHPKGRCTRRSARQSTYFIGSGMSRWRARALSVGRVETGTDASVDLCDELLVV